MLLQSKCLNWHISAAVGHGIVLAYIASAHHTPLDGNLKRGSIMEDCCGNDEGDRSQVELGVEYGHCQDY